MADGSSEQVIEEQQNLASPEAVDEILPPPVDAAGEDEEYLTLPPEEEIARLCKLKVPDLINELFFARQRLKTFLEDKGIPVPEFSLDALSHKNLLDLASSAYIESFTRESINSVGSDVEAVNSSVKSFVILFDSLISTNAFEEVSVSVEGMDEVITVKQLLEDYDNNRIDEEKKVVVTVKDLRDQLEALVDEDSSGNKSFEDIDDDDIAATRETGTGEDEGMVFQSKLGEGLYSSSQFSPFITQEVFDNLFRQKADGAEEDKPEEESVEQKFAEEPTAEGADVDVDAILAEVAPENIELFDDEAPVPIEEEDIFDDFYDGEETLSKDQAQDLTDNPADELIDSLSNDENVLVTNTAVIEKIVNDGSGEGEDGAVMAQIPKDTTVPKLEVDPELEKADGDDDWGKGLSNDDIDKLLGSM